MCAHGSSTRCCTTAFACLQITLTLDVGGTVCVCVCVCTWTAAATIEPNYNFAEEILLAEL